MMATIDLRPPPGGVITTKIDYLSFTIPGGVGDGFNDENTWNEVVQRVARNMGDESAVTMGTWLWRAQGGMGSYRHSTRSAESGVAIWYGGNANHILVQIPGTACTKFTHDGTMGSLVANVHERVTRLDVACDIDVQGLSPADFVTRGYNERFKSGGTRRSPTGTTEYIGGRQSERFSRVYRYAEPHPRAKLLRVEYELKGGYAKRAALALKNGSVSALARTLGDAFGWRHPAWDASKLGDALEVTSRGEREGAGSVIWLMQQVAPAMIRLHKDGIFDVKKWLEGTVIPSLE